MRSEDWLMLGAIVLALSAVVYSVWTVHAWVP